MKLLLCSLLLSLFIANVNAQVTRDYGLELKATTQVSPPKITVSWRPEAFGTPVYSVFKKAKSATSWDTAAISIITSGDTFYVDNSVIADSVYEYQVTVAGSGLTPYPTGYMLAGIKAPAIHNRGALVLLIDSVFTDSCSLELGRLMDDISGDGWQVLRHDLSRTLSDTAVKSVIRKDYNDVPNVKAVLIVGHLAVPYSGDMNPDAHPDHKGAWPADVYYGDLTGAWNDVFVNNIVSANPLNRNIPGDGKWDATTIPSDIQLQVSRFDFNSMPAFTATEVQMMRRYLNKAHSYKMDSLEVRRRALISDNFGVSTGEPFAENGWRNFAPLLTSDSIFTLPFIPTLTTQSYQWAYGCGGGSYTSAGGIGNTSDFATAGAVNSIFTMLFGSYFGDWNYQNNFLRAPLCADVPALTSCWAGRPNWFFHQMALGENIGYCARLTQNNTSLYSPSNFGARWVHVALMGDLTLRTDYIKPPSALTVTPVAAHGATLAWTISPDAAVIGYYVYRTDSAYGYYEKISPMLTTASFQDTVGTDGLKFYMVRPVKLQATPSGSYYNLGVGISNSATVDFPLVDNSVPLVSASVSVNIFPNPVQDRLSVIINSPVPTPASICFISMSGQQLYPANRNLSVGDNAFIIDVSALTAGIYSLCVRTGDRVVVKKWVKL